MRESEEAHYSNTTKQRNGLSKALKRFYGVGDCGFTLMSNVESYYFQFFLTNLAKFSPATAALIGTITTTVDACLSWIYGAIINSVKPGKWGRYRSWLVMVPWIIPFLYAFQFIKIGPEPLAAVIVVLAFVTSHVAWNFPYVANVAMISVAGKTPDERAQLASTRGAWANFSKVIFSYICPVLATFFAGIIGETNKYGATAFVLACVMAALYYAHFKMFDGYEIVEDVDTAKAKIKKQDKQKGGLLKALIQNPPLMALMLADLAKFLFNFVIAGSATYYFLYIAKNEDLTALYILISNIFCVVGSYAAKNLAKKFSSRSTVITMFFIMAVVLVVANFLYASVNVVIILMSLAQLGYGVAYSLTPALYADTIIYAEWKTGKNATGWISGLQNVPLKLGVLARSIVVPACLAVANFSADTVDINNIDPLLEKAICLAFMIVPAIALVVAALLMIFGFRLTKEKVIQYQDEIAARKSAT